MKSFLVFFGSVFVCLFFYTPAVHAEQAMPRCEAIDANKQCTLWGVSLIELIANPRSYHQKRVRVIGFVNLEFEGNAIYLHREDHQQRISANGLWLDLTGSQVVKRGDKIQKYSLIEATFDADQEGHMGAWSGSLKEITRLDPWEK